MPKKPSEIVQVKVRMREDQRRRIEKEAEKNGVTINAEILGRLEKSFTSADMAKAAAKAVLVELDERGLIDWKEIDDERQADAEAGDDDGEPR